MMMWNVSPIRLLFETPPVVQPSTPEFGCPGDKEISAGPAASANPDAGTIVAAGDPSRSAGDVAEKGVEVHRFIH